MTETQRNGAPAAANPPDEAPKPDHAVRTAVWLGVAGTCIAAAVAAAIVLSLRSRRPPDETTERIQVLIEEANRLIRTLEEKK